MCESETPYSASVAEIDKCEVTVLGAASGLSGALAARALRLKPHKSMFISADRAPAGFSFIQVNLGDMRFCKVEPPTPLPLQ